MTLLTSRYLMRPVFVCYLLTIILSPWTWTPTVGSSVSSSSVWTNDGEPASTKRRPFHWLQQHFPTIFGHHRGTNHNAARNTQKKTKSSNNNAALSSGAQHVGKGDGSRRRLLYQDSWRRHAISAWTAETNVSATAFHMYTQRSSSSTTTASSFPPFPPSMREATLEEIRKMFYHAYNGYYWNAWPHGELLPGSCEGTNFSLVKLPALTAIDALDTFWILGNTTEMARVVERLRQLQETVGKGSSLWDVNQNISVFETTIRVLGGLLSAHQIMLEEAQIWQHDVWDSITGSVLDGRSAASQPKQDATNMGSCPAPPPIVCQEGWPPCLDLDQTALPVTSTGSCDALNSTRRSATTASYKYDGYLLDLAIDIADRMLPAFDTDTGIPYGTVHLQTGVPRDETPIASLAGAGTLTLEWELLSRLTGKPVYGKVARRAARGLWMRQSSDFHLVGKHIDTRDGTWVESLSGIGSNSDSFIEYLVKYCFLFLDGKGADDDFPSLWPAIYQGIFKYMKKGDWYGDTDCNTPTVGRSVFESLMAFYPGLQIWLGELSPAARSLNAFFLVREHLGFLPERFSYNAWRADGPRYPLRPELFESNYFIHRAVQDIAVSSPFSNRSAHSGWLWPAMWSVQKLAQLRTSCGFASLRQVDPHSTGAVGGDGSTDWNGEDDMPSFFLSETLKYLYLTFDEDNPIHLDDDRHWMFTTEAHPIHLPNPPEDDNITDDLHRLEEILLRHSQGKRSRDHHEGAATDLWATETSFQDFLSKLWPVELEMKRQQIKKPYDAFFFKDRQLFETIDETSLVSHDNWEERRNFKNLAHIKFSEKGIGAGFSLRAACPNYYASELIWVHALNGESLDFTEDFRARKDDHVLDKRRRRPYGSVEALDFLGMSYNPSENGQGIGCPLRSIVNEKTRRKDKESEDVAEFVSDAGTFHINAFSDGTGFQVVKKEDGHVVTVSFMNSAEENEKGFATYLMLLSESGRTMGYTRHVRMADFIGNSYSCEVSLHGVLDEGDAEQSWVEIVRVPCTPGMFGPGHMSNLRASGGTTVQAAIYAPLPSDITGCEVVTRGKPASSSTPKKSFELLQLDEEMAMCPNTNIQMVSRGVCSFMIKAMNQKQGREADAVIVINTQENLFTMAGDPGLDELDPEQSPLSVMISRGDGKKLLAAIEGVPGRFYSRIIGKVALEAQPGADSLESIVASGASSSLPLPLVYATDSLIQIYAEGNWGVQAVAVESNWNLQLVRHNLG